MDKVIEYNPVVVGCINNYGWSDIEPWVVSLRKHYSGDVVMFCWPNISTDIPEKLRKYNITIVNVYETGENIVVSRFKVMREWLTNMSQYTHVLTTDVKDVIFQNTLRFNYDRLYITKEHFSYGEEPWSSNNIKLNFGNSVFDYMMHRPVVCAGIIGGPRESILSLFLNIYLICQGLDSYNSGGGGPDQSAMNIVLTGYPDDFQTSPLGDEYLADCVHLGTTYKCISQGGGEIGQRFMSGQLGKDISEKLKTMAITEIELMLIDGIIYFGDVPYMIVHQYDRIPSWKQIIKEKYKD